MPHRYNQQSFQAGASDSNNPLLCLYCSLVALELSIKDHFYRQSNSWESGHGIIDWLTTCLGEASLGRQLDLTLSALYCTQKNGSEAFVKAKSYPDIRYLRHESDFPGKSTDNQLKEVLDTIKDIRTSLISKGISL